MSTVLEPYFQIDVRSICLARLQQLKGHIESFLAKPLLRRNIIHLGKVTLKCGKATTCVVGKLRE